MKRKGADGQLPMMPWFPRDFIAATRLMTLSERGAYRELLDFQWELGTLPAETNRLFLLLGISADEFAAIWPAISDKFVRTERGLINERLEEHRAEAIRLSTIRKEVGKLGGRPPKKVSADPMPDAKANGNQLVSISLGKSQPNENHPSPSPSTEVREELSLIPSSSLNSTLSPAKRATDAAVHRIFDHWRNTHGHQTAKLDAKRTVLIGKALKSYSEDIICQSITGYLNSPHHMGDNPRATKYDSIELLLRSAKEIDAGIKFHNDPPRIGLSDKSRKAIDNMAGWTPPKVHKHA